MRGSKLLSILFMRYVTSNTAQTTDLLHYMAYTSNGGVMFDKYWWRMMEGVSGTLLAHIEHTL